MRYVYEVPDEKSPSGPGMIGIEKAPRGDEVPAVGFQRERYSTLFVVRAAVRLTLRQQPV
jgi:hypothetical protein